MTFAESKQVLVNTKLNSSLADIEAGSNQLFSSDDITRAINFAVAKVIDYKLWPFTEGSFTLTGSGPYSYDPGFEWQSAFLAIVDGVPWSGVGAGKRNFADYMKWFSDNPTDTSKIWTEYGGDLSATAANNKARLAFLEDQAKANATAAATKAKTDSAPPKTIQGANGATFQWDPNTGTFKQILPGKASPTNSTDPNTVIPKFNKDLANRATLDKAGTREQFIRQLQQLYPTINPDDIARKVYETYPDGYDAKTNKSSSSSSRSL